MRIAIPVATQYGAVREAWSRNRALIASCTVVFLLGFVLSFALLGYVLGLVPHQPPNFSIWFESDAVRVYSNLTDRWSDHYRTSVHPLSSLLLSTPTIVLIKLGLSPLTAARFTLALGAGLLASAFFALCRHLLGRTLDAALFTALLLVSSSFLFFTAIPELYAWGGFSIVLALMAATVAGPLSGPALVAASAFSASMTVTNWMAGIAASFVREPWARAVLYTALALAIVAALSVVQGVLYASSGKFLSVIEEPRYVHLDFPARLFEVTRVVFLGSVVLDRLTEAMDPVGNPFVSAQRGALVLGAAGWAALLLWLGLLGAGAYQAWLSIRHKTRTSHLALLAVVLILGQYALHLVYGGETFLYSLHYAPLLVLLASFAAMSPWRHVVLPAAALAVLLAGWHNLEQLQRAYAIADHLLQAHELPPHTPRQQVLDEMAERPDDLWPRGAGHVPLGLQGLPEARKAYLEPGGSFSPAVGSFGVSFWVRDSAGLKSSDTIPLSEISQSFVGRDASDGVGVRSETSAYVAEWRQHAPGKWDLSLRAKDNAPPIELVLRSVGPAGGRIGKIESDGEALIVGTRWRVAPANGLRRIYIGDERDKEWKSRRNSVMSVTSPGGWSAARFAVEGDARLTIVDLAHVPSHSDLEMVPLQAQSVVEGADARFFDALTAQITQLMMGIVGDQTRPGDPTHYPLAWQRDGAYVVAALAQAGRLDAARLLVRDLAERDFFGGFGAEADAPGLALWAIGLVSRGLEDREFDLLMWPHVFRKAELIVRMATSAAPMRAEYSGPVVKAYERHEGLSHVSDPATDGLIEGRMDWHRPRMYVTAESIRGLKEAIRFARLFDETSRLESWDRLRARLESAYGEALARGTEIENDRTLAVGLDVPVPPAAVTAFRDGLERNWQDTRGSDGAFKARPLWTYFELAKARQWLRLGEPDRTWATVRWFWDNSPAPGLFTLWESDHEEHAFGLWQRVRGWVAPPHVTPHYWASAEMLLTQVAMLAYADGETVVLGAGVPADWLGRPLAVRDVVTDAGRVSWQWDGSALTAVVCDHGIKVRAGGAFAGKEVAISTDGCRPQ